jgi:type IV secretory pathway VirB10-like protein
MLPGLLVVAVLLSALGGWWWWQSRPLNPGALHRRAPLPQLMQLRKSTVFVIAAVVLGLCLGTVWIVRRTLVSRGTKKTPVQAAKAPVTTPAPATAEFLRKYPKEYATNTPPPAEPPALPPRGIPVEQPRNGTPPVTPVAVASGPPPLSRAELQEVLTRILTQHQEATDAKTKAAIAQALADYERTHPPVVVPGQPTGQPAPPATPGNPADDAWKWRPGKDAEGTTLGKRFQKPREEQAQAAKASTLFPPAQWETPAEPTRVIYSSQLIQGQLAQVIVTGESATVRVKVSETLYDKFGQQVPLIPMGSSILGLVEGKVRRGQTRIPMGVSKVELPDGTDLVLEGKAGDAGGGVGIPGDVDNRYPQVLLGAILTTLFALAPQVAAGNTTNYQPTVEQDIARNLGQSVNQTGQQFVREMLAIEPIITAHVGDPVTIQLSKNVSLMSKPVIVRK